MSTARAEQSEYELFQEDLDRLAPHIETAIARVPAFGEVGVKKVYNGAIAYTPDGSPIIGPAWDLPNFWLNEGHSFGVTAAGGAGWQLAEWIVEGEPTIDMMGVDPRRFGPYAARGYLQGARTRRPTPTSSPSTIPDEERGGGAAAEARALLRPDEGARRRVRLGLRLGAAELVRARRATASSEAELDKPDVLLNENHPPVPPGERLAREMELPPLQLLRASSASECRQRARERRPAGHVGLRQMRGLRARAPRPGSTRILANRMPKKIGRIGLCPSAVARTAACARSSPSTATAPDRFYLVSAGACERHDFDYLSKLLPARRRVALPAGDDASTACWCSPARARASCCRS